jgi:diguanylate cyclase (GGDEF)-like protein
LTSQHRWLLAGGLLLALLIQWGTLFWWAEVEEQHVIESNRKYLTQLANTVSAQMLHQFELVETTLRAADAWIESHPQIEPHHDQGFLRLIEEVQRASGRHSPVQLISVPSKNFSLSVLAVGPKLEVQDSATTGANSEPSIRTFQLGSPGIYPLTGKPGIRVTLPIRSPGNERNVLLSYVDFDRLPQLKTVEDSPPNGTIALIRMDGVILARSPYDANFVGKSIRSNQNYTDRLVRHKEGYYTSDSPSTDHVRRFVSFKRVGDYPLVATVSIGESEVMAAWYKQRNLVFILGALLSVAFMALAAGLWSLMKKIQLSAQILESQASIDVLTGRLNRRAFFDIATREFERCQRYQHSFSVMMLDIDLFKQVNDTYGHAAGDIVLRCLADCWFNSLRRVDVVGRIGGEEFAILLPGTSLDDAQMLAERLRESTQELEISSHQGVLRVTVSIGITKFDARDNHFAQTLERADAALYKAKQAGRNQVQRV